MNPLGSTRRNDGGLALAVAGLAKEAQGQGDADDQGQQEANHQHATAAGRHQTGDQRSGGAGVPRLADLVGQKAQPAKEGQDREGHQSNHNELPLHALTSVITAKPPFPSPPQVGEGTVTPRYAICTATWLLPFSLCRVRRNAPHPGATSGPLARLAMLYLQAGRS